MREDKCTHSKGGRVKIPLLPNSVGKRAGQEGHNSYFWIILEFWLNLLLPELKFSYQEKFEKYSNAYNNLMTQIFKKCDLPNSLVEIHHTVFCINWVWIQEHDEQNWNYQNKTDDPRCGHQSKCSLKNGCFVTPNLQVLTLL